MGTECSVFFSGVLGLKEGGPCSLNLILKDHYGICKKGNVYMKLTWSNDGDGKKTSLEIFLSEMSH